MNKVLLIPAYNPEPKIVSILSSLDKNEFQTILVVNDGSADKCRDIFRKISAIKNTVILTHDENKGKGAALKTGFSYVRDHMDDCAGVVTADADGQHSKKDILAVSDAMALSGRDLVIGSRSFDKDVPLRSSIGNRMTRLVMKLLFKIDLRDTQSGLRAIPFPLLDELLKIPYSRYEFEAEMLMAAKRSGYGFKEVAVETIYENNNATSSFNPIIDSAKIYFILFRYIIASLITAAVDYMVFFASYSFIPHVFYCTYFARFIALFVNFIFLKEFVFHSREKIFAVAVKYLSLVVVSGFVSSLVIEYFKNTLNMNIVVSKISAELLLYFAIFVAQKEFVFRRKGK